jgi:hypothetical protein
MKNSPFEFPQTRTAVLGALGFGIGLPFLVKMAEILPSAIIENIPIQFLLFACWGAIGGFALGLAETSRRRTLRLAAAGAAGIGLGWLAYFFLSELVHGIIPEPMVRRWMGEIIIGAFLGIILGCILGRWKTGLLLAGVGMAAFGLFFLIPMLWMGKYSNPLVSLVIYFTESAAMGAAFGWSLARLHPSASATPKSALSKPKVVYPLKRAAGCALLLIAVLVVIRLSLILPRFFHSSPEVRPVAQSSLPPLPAGFPKIDRHPAAMWVGAGSRGVIQALPSYDPGSWNAFQMDFRSKDLSSLDLRNSLPDLMHAAYDDQTIWPPADRMPEGFDWERIMDLGKNPGLGIRSLHAMGITGRGVGIAIIDAPLIVEHREYANQLRLYEEAGYPADTPANMHGTAVASIAVGKTVGVAPDADLYFIANDMCNQGTSGSSDFVCVAKSVHRILDLNESLPVGRKIRVISMSFSWGPSSKGFQEIMDAVREANAAGVFVISTGTVVTNNFNLCPLGRDPLADPDAFSSYEPGIFTTKGFLFWLDDEINVINTNCLWVTMDSRTTASPTGAGDYVFYREGGMSWSVPYVSGIYALAAQVDPTITPEKFLSLALATGRMVTNGQTLILGPIIDPAALIAALQNGQ